MLCAVGLAARPSTKLASASANASPSTPNGWFDAQMLPTIPCGLSDMGPRMRSSLGAVYSLIIFCPEFEPQFSAYSSSTRGWLSK